MMIKQSELLAEQASRTTRVDAGDYFIGILKAGETLRILDLEGNQAADTLFYSADNPAERYSAMDTIREQGNVYLTTGSKLRS
ncbi:MAG: urea carboxylase-associated family protein, partial [Candidatus Thiodiazotropha taylori]